MTNLAFNKKIKKKKINFARYASDELLMPGYIWFSSVLFPIFLPRIHTYLTLFWLLHPGAFSVAFRFYFRVSFRCICAGLSKLLQNTLV